MYKKIFLIKVINLSNDKTKYFYDFKKFFILLNVLFIYLPNLFPQTISFNHLTTVNGLSNNTVYDVLQDQTGFIWFATDNGLNRYDGYEFKVFKHNPKDDNSLSDNSILSFMEDSFGKIWIGTKGGWLNCYDPVNNKFKKWKIKSDITGEYSITFIIEDRRNKIWVGTNRSGLYRFDPLSGMTENWLNKSDDNKSFSNNYIHSILEDNNGKIWINTSNGLNILNQDNLQSGFLHLYHQPSEQKKINDSLILFISKSNIDKNKIWLGTANGLTSYRTDNQLFSNVLIRRPDILQFGNLSRIIEENINQNQILWINSYAGLIRLNISTGKITRFIPDKNNPQSLSNGEVNAIIKDKSGIIWIATNNGINNFSLRKINFNDPLPDKHMQLNPGEISNKIDEPYSSFLTPVLLTDFQIFNKSVLAGEQSPLKTCIQYTKEIKLSYTQNLFSFQFAALEYSSPQSIKYAYKMEGFDDDWVKSGSRRFATYTNLNPGEYIFKVKASNPEGNWNDNISSIRLIISPPWWQTAWAIGIYIIIFILGSWGIIKFQVNRTHLRHELKMREYESHHLREIENMKSRFFANLSHEFRTPLMLIKGPLEQLIAGRIKNNLIECYRMLLRNTEKLQQLIDELLELSQLESETIPLHKQQHDLVKILKVITDAFMPLAGENNINLSFTSDVKTLVAMIDRDKLEKIINNLLNNAFKFTPDFGKINVELSLDKQEKTDIAKISISDTGMGIPEEHRSKIFDRFYQIDNISKRNYGSSGIGLALVKELVSLHNWNISVFSKVGEGTVFSLRIPLEKQAEKQDKITSNDLVIKKDDLQNKIDLASLSSNIIKKPREKPVLLFVEDSEDVRSYVTDLLSEDYKVISAAEAEEGLELAAIHMPELIISDIMMEGMDGIEFCKKIKNDWQTSHIPVILLTAKAAKESKIEGLTTGADDYIIKPFNYEELFVRIKNLIEQRKSLREKFSKELKIKPDLLNNPVDKEFLDKVYEVLERNLSNEEFDTELLAKEIFVSRRQLHRKIQAITGQAPGEFIRVFKLRKAAQMLLENKFSITQIAFEVGFGSPSQFTRAFNKFFGFLPSEFKERISNKSHVEN